MSTVLALTLRPTDENIMEFAGVYDAWMDIYGGVSIVVPPDAERGRVDLLRSYDGVRVHISPGDSGTDNRRYRTLKQALTFDGVRGVHYCDGDHALKRFAQDPDDWHDGLQAMQVADCLIVGRMKEVFDSYPQALRDTERIINDVGSHLLRQPVDLGSGARGFSRAAVEYIIDNDHANSNALATDSAWPVLLHHAGFKVAMFWSRAATYDVPNEATRERLESKDQWIKRVGVAQAIIAAGIRAANGTYR